MRPWTTPHRRYHSTIPACWTWPFIILAVALPTPPAPHRNLITIRFTTSHRKVSSNVCDKFWSFCSFVVRFSIDFSAFPSADDCTLNSNPIAASTRVSALNIVADLLKKLDVSNADLWHKLDGWTTNYSIFTSVLIFSESWSKAEVVEDAKVAIAEINRSDCLVQQ